MTQRAEQSDRHVGLRLVADQTAIDARALRSLQSSVPLVAPEPRWIGPGQAGWCMFWCLVLVCEFAVLAWEIWGRR